MRRQQSTADTNSTPANAGLYSWQNSKTLPRGFLIQARADDAFCLSSSPLGCALWVVPVDAKVFHVSKKRLNLLSINLLLWVLYLVIMIKSSLGWRDSPPINTRSQPLLILWLKLEISRSSGGSKSYGKVNTQVISLVNKKALIGHISGGHEY